MAERPPEIQTPVPRFDPRGRARGSLLFHAERVCNFRDDAGPVLQGAFGFGWDKCQDHEFSEYTSSGPRSVDASELISQYVFINQF